MRQIYSRSTTITFRAGDSGYVLGERVDPGYVLHVRTCFAHAPQREANDNVIIGIRHGGQDVILFAVAPGALQRGVEIGTRFFAGEGDQVFAYFPDADDGDTIGLNINGTLVPLVVWEKGLE